MVILLRHWKLIAGLLVVLAVGILNVPAARADDNPWDAGSNWMYVRAGLARNTADGAGNGGAGYGFGFRHMLKPSKVNDVKVLGIKPLGFLHWTMFKNWSIGAFTEYDVLGRYGLASEIEIPTAFEMTRYLMWKSAARPYLTLGTGAFLRKTYRTGADRTRVTTSNFLATGFDVPVASNQLLGVDVRMASVDNANIPANPVFGSGQTGTRSDGHGGQQPKYMATHWSMKLSYAVHY